MPLVVAGDEGEATRTYELVGPLCFAGDVLARDLLLPELAEGDWLAIEMNGCSFGQPGDYDSTRRGHLRNDGGRDPGRALVRLGMLTGA